MAWRRLALKTGGVAQHQLCLTLAGTGGGHGGGPWPPLFPIPTHQGGTSPRVSCEIGDLGRHGGEGVSSGSLSPL